MVIGVASGFHNASLISAGSIIPLIHLLGISCFAYIVARRLVPLFRAERDWRLDQPWTRLARVAQYWLTQWKHPRYPTAGLIHILIFAGFLILATRAFTLLIFGAGSAPILGDATGHLYEVVADYAATVVFVCVTVAAVRRIVFRPARYAVPHAQGNGHAADAIFLLALIGLLMLAESLFEATHAVLNSRHSFEASFLPVGSLSWLMMKASGSISSASLWKLYASSYLLDILTFYFLLCYRPFGIQFHVETSLFNVYFAKLERGSVKPVRVGVPDEQLEQLKDIGVKKFEDFTWKHILDFYSCADCGRCSDNCPANAVGRPLSPRFLTTKARDYSFRHFPVFGSIKAGPPLLGGIFSEDEIWSCTTCAACEEECPLLIQYVDKIVDLRRGLIDDGNVPKSIQKALNSVASRGNPYGKLEKKRAEWTREEEFGKSCKVPIASGNGGAKTLYFVDSITSYDDRIQAVGRATARILSQAREEFAILGPAERDSGHDVRRFGEEMLFMDLRARNTKSIQLSGATRIVTSDPHAYNALKHDYHGLPPVEHMTQFISSAVSAGRIKLQSLSNSNDIFTFHDPCYLGRHNHVYDEPRMVLDAIPGLRRVEMTRCRDRSFCCGGGGLMLFYEPKEEQRMGVKRVQMAADAGANAIVTACPFCMVNIEDAIKVAGMEQTMRAIDLVELVDQHLIRERTESVSASVDVPANAVV